MHGVGVIGSCRCSTSNCSRSSACADAEDRARAEDDVRQRAVRGHDHRAADRDHVGRRLAVAAVPRVEHARELSGRVVAHDRLAPRSPGRRSASAWSSACSTTPPQKDHEYGTTMPTFMAEPLSSARRVQLLLQAHGARSASRCYGTLGGAPRAAVRAVAARRSSGISGSSRASRSSPLPRLRGRASRRSSGRRRRSPPGRLRCTRESTPPARASQACSRRSGDLLGADPAARAPSGESRTSAGRGARARLREPGRRRRRRDPVHRFAGHATTRPTAFVVRRPTPARLRDGDARPAASSAAASSTASRERNVIAEAARRERGDRRRRRRTTTRVWRGPGAIDNATGVEGGAPRGGAARRARAHPRSVAVRRASAPRRSASLGSQLLRRATAK